MGLVAQVLYSGISRVKLLCCCELVVASGIVVLVCGAFAGWFVLELLWLLVLGF